MKLSFYSLFYMRVKLVHLRVFKTGDCGGNLILKQRKQSAHWRASPFVLLTKINQSGRGIRPQGMTAVTSPLATEDLEVAYITTYRSEPAQDTS